MKKLAGHLSDLGEEAIIKQLIEPIATDIGDDAAQITVPPEQQLIVSADSLVEGIHFLRESPPELIGRKALGANISDMAASGAKPRWITLTLNLPKDLPLQWLADFTAGLGSGLEQSEISLIGGDVTASLTTISVSITIMGLRCAGRLNAKSQPFGRGGAKIGDWVVVTGFLGESLPGLQVILKAKKLDPESEKKWQERHFITPNRAAFGQALFEQNLASAMMDLSDGLAKDLPRLASRSEVGLAIDLDRLPLSKPFKSLGYEAVDAFYSGEDYELLFTLCPSQWQCLEILAAKMEVPISVIGHVTRGSGVTLVQQGKPVRMEQHSWHHF